MNCLNFNKKPKSAKELFDLAHNAMYIDRNYKKAFNLF